MPSAGAASTWPCVDREDAGADDLGHVGGLVQAQAEDRGQELGDDVLVVPTQTRSRERDAERETAGRSDRVEPEEELDQHRGAAEEPDVDPAAPRDDRVGGQAHDGEQDAEHDPMTMAITVSSSVVRTARKISGKNRKSLTTPQLRPGAVANV